MNTEQVDTAMGCDCCITKYFEELANIGYTIHRSCHLLTAAELSIVLAQDVHNCLFD